MNTHIYIGTSGWVSTVIERPKLDIACKIAESWVQTNTPLIILPSWRRQAKCIEWVKDHLAYEETVKQLRT